MKEFKRSFLLCLMAGFAVAATDPLPSKDLQARGPADLGPDSVDVSAYPADQQDNYALFKQVCSRCHTAARAINATITSHEDWEHFVSLMHARLVSRSMKSPWSASEAQRLVSFLTYDSHVRKVLHADDFDRLQKQLAERFQAVQQEKSRRAKEQPAQPSAPYTGANP